MNISTAVNGKEVKKSYAWSGKVNRAVKGFDVALETMTNGKRRHLTLKNQTPSQIKKGIHSFLKSKKRFRRSRR
jgi:S1-C subfamily serine protease